MCNGIGIDFGSTACRVAICREGQSRLAPKQVWVSGGAVNVTFDRERKLPVDPEHPEEGDLLRWLRLETAKSSLGTGRKLSGAPGSVAGTFADQAREQFAILQNRLVDYLKAEVLGAVVGVPSSYGINQRAAVRSALEAGGFGSGALVDESLAAVLYCCRDLDEPKTLLLYCLGQSVFSASVYRVENGVFQALTHEGSTQLGGQDFEALLVQNVIGSLKKEGVDILNDQAAIQELIKRSEKAKVNLSATDKIILKIGPLEHSTSGRKVEWKAPLSRRDLEVLTGPLVAQTVSLSQRAVQDAGLAREQIDEILLVGKATRMPLIAQELKNAFVCPLREAPVEAVACGAALHAAAWRNCFVPEEAVAASADTAEGERAQHKEQKKHKRKKKRKRTKKNRKR